MAKFGMGLVAGIILMMLFYEEFPLGPADVYFRFQQFVITHVP